jgi:aspartyl-tRNA(Asn)/glutamyl-tRNA(Gln) amidotransferase subunit B
VEIKNLNSMKAVRGALEYEIRRQGRLLKEGKTVEQETRLWDEERERSARMRTKEEAQDYRYFPEPDLLPLEIDDAMMERVSAAVPELPLARRRRFRSEFGLNDYDAGVLTDQCEVADYFEAARAAHDSPKSLANWIMNVVLREVNERQISIQDFEIPPERLAELVRLTDEGRINANVAREIMAKMVETGKDAVTLVEEEGVEQISDESALAEVIEQVINENPQIVRDYLGGKQQAVGPLVGKVMQATRGKADPKLANRLLAARLDELARSGQ